MNALGSNIHEFTKYCQYCVVFKNKAQSVKFAVKKNNSIKPQLANGFWNFYTQLSNKTKREIQLPIILAS